MEKMPNKHSKKVRCSSPSMLNPKSIPGLMLWLKADKGVYTDAAMTIPATADAQTIGGWQDQSGQGNHVTQATVDQRPVLKLNIQGGKSVIRFDPTASQILNTAVSNTVPKQAPFTAFAVVQTNSNAPSGSRRIMGFHKSGGIGWAYGQYISCGSMRGVKHGIANINGLLPFFSTDKFEITTLVFDATFNTTLYINGGKRDYIASAADCGAGDINFYVGGDVGANQFWGGDIAEVIVYAAALSEAQRQLVENYLARKYNITKAPSLNVASYYTIPDYPGLGTVVHPDVLYFAAGWNGYKYWMAYTPCPPTANENPSIAVSNDGETWITPPGLTNPIDANPGGGANNSDASLCMSADNVTMYIVWREFKAATVDKIYLSSSADGVTWAAPTLILSPATNQGMSPSVLWDGAQFVMWLCATSTYPLFQQYTCATIDGIWSAATQTTWLNSPGPIGASISPKHADMILSGGVYYLICMDVDNGINGGLYLATSADGLAWKADPNFRLPVQVGVWDYLPYRASLLPVGDGLDIYYSGFDVVGTTCKIGKTHYRLP
jgi:hypothetical protein